MGILKQSEQQQALFSGLKNNLGLNNNSAAAVSQERDMKQMQRMLEETLTKNMHLQKDLEHLSQEVVRLSKQNVVRPDTQQVSSPSTTCD